MNIYHRQQQLNLYIPKKIVLIGAGGIGSWIGLSFALLGVKEMEIYDPDEIEPHNLNRTPYKIEQIGMNKAFALAELIYERRPDAIINAIPEEAKDLSTTETDLIIDCKDNTQIINHNPEAKYIKLGYDGTSFTIDPEKTFSKSWDTQEYNTYRIVPSFVGTPMLIAAIILNSIANKEEINKTITKDVKDVVKTIQKD